MASRAIPAEGTEDDVTNPPRIALSGAHFVTPRVSQVQLGVTF